MKRGLYRLMKRGLYRLRKNSLRREAGVSTPA
jgi:hypothetical protein